MAATDIHFVIETIFREERPRLIASLARLVRDIDLAEEVAQDALVTALAAWPESGIPQNPAAWLTAVGKRRALDGLRRAKMMALKHAELARGFDEGIERHVETLDAALDDDIGDELLGLIFTACHPQLSLEARAALTLRLIGGLTTTEIARAFLTTEPTIAQRIVRAKKTLAGAGALYEVPRGPARQDRLYSVLAVIYLIFNEGYAATAGDDLTRPSLCAEAQRLARLLARLMPDEPEVFGLLALLELQASRLAARTTPEGAAIMLPDQDRARWDQALIKRGFAALAQAEALGGADGPYALQAALAACHARAGSAAETDWVGIAQLYDRLASAMPSPIVALGRAIAHSMAFGPEAGLALVQALPRTEALDRYAPLAAATGDFLFRLGRYAEAKPQFEHAAALSTNRRERDFLLGRAAACDTQPTRA